MTLKKERVVSRRAAFFRLEERVTSGSECEQWPCVREKQSAVVASIKDDHSSISIWFTSFEPEYSQVHAERLFFSAADIILWVQGAKHLAVTQNIE